MPSAGFARRWAALLMGALCCAAVLWVTLGLAPGPAVAQSVLSMPGADAGAPNGADVAPLAAPEDDREPSAHSMSLDELFNQVGLGNGHAVYGELRKRYENSQLPDAVWAKPTELRRTYLLYLLRAGEGLAPPEELEFYAREFTVAYPDDPRFPVAYYHLTWALFRQDKALEDSFFFDDDALASLPAWQQSRYLRLRAQSEVQREHPLEAARYLLREMESPATLRTTTAADVEEVLAQAPTSEALQAFLKSAAASDWLARREPFLVAQALLNEGQVHQALVQVQTIRTQGLAVSAAEEKQVNELRTEIRARVALHPERIGVLLPLGSSSQVLRTLALETLHGLRMAVQFPDADPTNRQQLERLLGQDLALGRENQQGDSSRGVERPQYELVVRDTGNSPDAARRQVVSLVEDEQVVAIIGPIARSESEAAAKAAEAAGVPLISLSLSLDIPKNSSFVFRHSKSQEEEIRDLVRYATDYLQLRRFAVLYPEDGFGRDMLKLFWETVEGNGGKIVGAGSYVPSARGQDGGSVGLKDIFERFTGMDRPVGPEERALLDAVGDDLPDPLVDFDALFIPVGPDGIPDLQLIAPYPITVDAEHVQLLGNRFWNDPAVMVAGQEKLEGAIFVDAFDRSSTIPKVEAFHTRHRTFFGHDPEYHPPSYYTGLGYDTARLVMALLDNPRLRTRKELGRALHGMKPFSGVTGWTSFDAHGVAVKESMFFRMRQDEITRIMP